MVKESLEDPNHKPEVFEFKATMTSNMEEIHKSIIAVMNACIKELQRTSTVMLFILIISFLFHKLLMRKKNEKRKQFPQLSIIISFPLNRLIPQI
jgi:flagellar biogenesis protein FliO